MATAIAEAFVLVKPQTEGFQNQLKSQLNQVTSKASPNVKVNADTKGLAPKLSSEFKRIAGIGTAIFAGIFAFKGAFDFLKGAIDKSKQAEEAQLKLNTAFQTFPKLTNISKDSLLGLNRELSLKTKFDKDALASGQAVLAQFNLTGQQVKLVTPLLADYAAKAGQDIPSAANSLGKAFLGTTRALKTVGINYKSTGDAGKDFTNITDLLRQKVGGFATKEGASFSGRIEIMKNQLGELQKTIGAAVLPIFAKIADFLVSKLFPALKTIGGFLIESFRPAFDVVREAASKFFGAISTVAQTVFNKFATSTKILSVALHDLAPAILAVGAAFVAAKIFNEIQNFTGAVKGLQKAAQAAGGGLSLLRAGFSTIGNVITPLNAAIAGVAAITFLLIRRNIEARQQVQDLADALGQEAKGAKDATDQLILHRLEQDGLLKSLNASGISVRTYIDAVKGSASATDEVTTRLSAMAQAAGANQDIMVPLVGSIVQFDAKGSELGSTLDLLQGQFKEATNKTIEHAKAEDDLAGATDKATTSTEGAIQTSNRFTRSAARQNKEVVTMQDEFKRVSSIVDHFKTSLDSTLGSLLNIQDTTAKYDQDLAALGTSLKENGKSFDLNTEKGRNNSSALRAVVGDIEDQIGALTKGGKIQATDIAQKDALVTRLRQLEQRFPAVKGQVTSYIDEVNKTPVTRSTKFNVDTAKAKQDLGLFEKQLGGLAGPHHIITDIGFTQSVKTKIESIGVGSVNMTASTVNLSSGSVLRRAFGGPVSAGDPFLVGERGPELFIPKSSGKIVPNDRLRGGFTSQDVDRIIQAIEKAIQLSRPIQVNQVAQSPVATAEAVAARLGLAGVR